MQQAAVQLGGCHHLQPLLDIILLSSSLSAAGYWQRLGKMQLAAVQQLVKDAVAAALWMLKVQPALTQSVVLRCSWVLCRGWPRCRAAALKMLKVQVTVADTNQPLLLRWRRLLWRGWSRGTAPDITTKTLIFRCCWLLCRDWSRCSCAWRMCPALWTR